MCLWPRQICNDNTRNTDRDLYHPLIQYSDTKAPGAISLLTTPICEIRFTPRNKWNPVVWNPVHWKQPVCLFPPMSYNDSKLRSLGDEFRMSPGGYYTCFTLSVLLSVRPSVGRIVLAPLCIFHSTSWIHLILTYLINQLRKVCRVLSFLISKCLAFFKIRASSMSCVQVIWM